MIYLLKKPRKRCQKKKPRKPISIFLFQNLLYVDILIWVTFYLIKINCKH